MKILYILIGTSLLTNFAFAKPGDHYQVFCPNADSLYASDKNTAAGDSIITINGRYQKYLYLNSIQTWQPLDKVLPASNFSPALNCINPYYVECGFENSTTHKVEYMLIAPLGVVGHAINVKFSSPIGIEPRTIDFDEVEGAGGCSGNQ